MKMNSKNIVLILLIALIIGLSGLAVYRGTSQQAIGAFTSKATCDSQLTTYTKTGFYACTLCDTKYSDTAGYWSAWCFGSGTKGEQCIKGGGTCSDAYCATCAGQVQTCTESTSTYKNLDNGNQYLITNWGNVCGKNIIRTVCYNGYTRVGNEYSTSPTTTCTSSTVAQPAPAPPVNPCAGFTSTTCDGTTLNANPVQNGAVCQYAVIQINSAQCGYVPPNPCIGLSATKCDGTTLQLNLTVKDGKCGYGTNLPNSALCGYNPPQPVPCATGSACSENTTTPVDNSTTTTTTTTTGTTGASGTAGATGNAVADTGTTSTPSSFFDKYAYYIGGGLIIALLGIYLMLDSKDRKKKGKRR